MQVSLTSLTHPIKDHSSESHFIQGVVYYQCMFFSHKNNVFYPYVYLIFICTYKVFQRTESWTFVREDETLNSIRMDVDSAQSGFYRQTVAQKKRRMHVHFLKQEFYLFIIFLV